MQGVSRTFMQVGRYECPSWVCSLTKASIVCKSLPGFVQCYMLKLDKHEHVVLRFHSLNDRHNHDLAYEQRIESATSKGIAVFVVDLTCH